MADVPNAPGVPALLTGFAANPVGTVLMTADAVGAFFGGAGPQWGIFLNGVNAITADTVTAFDYKRDFTIADYPVERGAFETYDKVQLPYMPRVRLTSGMNAGNVASLIAAVDAAAQSYNLYDVVTPTAVYTGVNIHHYDYRRTANSGAGMVTVDVWMQQVIVSVTTGSSAASGINQNSGGGGSGGGGGAGAGSLSSTSAPATWSNQPTSAPAGSGITASPSGADSFSMGTVTATPITGGTLAAPSGGFSAKWALPQ